MITDKAGVKRRVEFDQSSVAIGRIQGNDIVLPRGNVSKRHARLTSQGHQFTIEDLDSTNGTYVNGKRITAPLSVSTEDKIYVGDFMISIDTDHTTANVEAHSVANEPTPVIDSLPEIPEGNPTIEHMQPSLLESIPPEPGSSGVPEPTQEFEQPPEPPPQPDKFEAKTSEMEPPNAELSDAELSKEAIPIHQLPKEEEASPKPPPIKSASSDERPMDILMSRLEPKFDVKDTSAAGLQDEQRWTDAQALISEAIKSMQKEKLIDEMVNARALASAALHEAVGLGPLDELLSDREVKLILVMSASDISVDRGAKPAKTDLHFSSEEAFLTTVGRLAAQASLDLDAPGTALSGTLAFGPSISIVRGSTGPVIEIRCLQAQKLAELKQSKFMTPKQLSALKEATEADETILVAGSVGSGVTQLINALAQEVDESKLLVVLEEIPQLTIERPQTISVGKSPGETLSSTLNSLRNMHADRIVIDGVLASELPGILEILSALKTGSVLGLDVNVASADIAEISMKIAPFCAHNAEDVESMLRATVHRIVTTVATPSGPRIAKIENV